MSRVLAKICSHYCIRDFLSCGPVKLVDYPLDLVQVAVRFRLLGLDIIGGGSIKKKLGDLSVRLRTRRSLPFSLKKLICHPAFIVQCPCTWNVGHRGLAMFTSRFGCRSFNNFITLLLRLFADWIRWFSRRRQSTGFQRPKISPMMAYPLAGSCFISQLSIRWEVNCA